ncbi:MAG: short-chain fatty acyl-CoA regulator family protein [Candidatus Eisenbacteria bacterium]
MSPESNDLSFVPSEISSEQWRGIARGLQAHLLQTARRQMDLASQAGLASSNLSTYLNLRRIPSRGTMRRIVAAAMATQGVTASMVDHWMRQLDESELRLRERLAELLEGGLDISEGDRERLLAAVSADSSLARTFLKLSNEIGSCRSKCGQLAMAHTDAARESLVQAAVEAFQLDPRMRHLTREVERDIRRAHAEERRKAVTPVEALQGYLEKAGVRIERVEPASPRSGRGRWEGIRWLLSLKDAKRATISTSIHPEQYPFELGRVVGQMRMMQVLGAGASEEIEGFAGRWVADNFPEVTANAPQRSQIEQDIIWLIFRSLAGRWATGFFTLPADRFVRLAESCAYDVDRLAVELNVPFETIANRISQLDSGIPVHFIKMDWRGVVLKRSSFSGLAFAPLYMRVCGRWASARSLLTGPGSTVRQYGVFPDLAGETYFCISRCVRAPALSFASAPLVYSLTIGVQARDAGRLVYASEFSNPPVECGVTCRLCTVLNCENRVCPSVSQPGMGKFDSSLVWSGKTIHERFPGRG